METDSSFCQRGCGLFVLETQEKCQRTMNIRGGPIINIHFTSISILKAHFTFPARRGLIETSQSDGYLTRQSRYHAHSLCICQCICMFWSPQARMLSTLLPCIIRLLFVFRSRSGGELYLFLIPLALAAEDAGLSIFLRCTRCLRGTDLTLHLNGTVSKWNIIEFEVHCFIYMASYLTRACDGPTVCFSSHPSPFIGNVSA
jgi:hypothetical protein